MNRKLALVCLAAMAYVGCATAELVQPQPLASCETTHDCPPPDSGTDAPADSRAEATPGDAAGDTGVTDSAPPPDAADSGAQDAADADATG